jgi:hypothetical protein
LQNTKGYGRRGVMIVVVVKKRKKSKLWVHEKQGKRKEKGLKKRKVGRSVRERR